MHSKLFEDRRLYHIAVSEIEYFPTVKEYLNSLRKKVEGKHQHNLPLPVRFCSVDTILSHEATGEDM